MLMALILELGMENLFKLLPLGLASGQPKFAMLLQLCSDILQLCSPDFFKTLFYQTLF